MEQLILLMDRILIPLNFSVDSGIIQASTYLQTRNVFLSNYLVQQREKSWFSGSLRSRLQYLGPNPGLPSLSESRSSYWPGRGILFTCSRSKSGRLLESEE